MGERAPKKTWALSADQIRSTSGRSWSGIGSPHSSGGAFLRFRQNIFGPCWSISKIPSILFNTHSHTRRTMEKAEEGRKKKKKWWPWLCVNSVEKLWCLFQEKDQEYTFLLSPLVVFLMHFNSIQVWSRKRESVCPPLFSQLWSKRTIWTSAPRHHHSSSISLSYTFLLGSRNK